MITLLRFSDPELDFAVIEPVLLFERSKKETEECKHIKVNTYKGKLLKLYSLQLWSSNNMHTHTHTHIFRVVHCTKLTMFVNYWK